MKSSAHVSSIDAVRQFSLAVREFDLQSREGLSQLALEVRRAIDWIEHDRLRYWVRESRRASDGLTEARIQLQRCEMAARPEDRRPCTEERKQLERARRRLRLCDEKVQITRQWVVKLKHESDEFLMQISRLSQHLDGAMPRALAALDRMASALEKYIAATGGGGMGGGGSGGSTSQASEPAAAEPPGASQGPGVSTGQP